MNNNEEFVALSETPNELLSSITGMLYPHLTALFRLSKDQDGNEKAIHIGAGTFVTIGEIYGILTATHVSDEISAQNRLGLVAAREGDVHHFEVDRSTLSIIPLASRNSDELGPDVSFIVLSDWEKIETLKANKLFYNLDKEQEALLTNPPPLDAGIWFACGTPEESVSMELSQAGFDRVISLGGYCGIGGVDKTFENNGYDYYECPIESNPDGKAPSDYKGMSGGSLWQITILRSEEKDLIPSHVFLIGVIFYQGIRSSGVRFLRCHGQRSIYRQLVDRVYLEYA
jgi:hypothetical protein